MPHLPIERRDLALLAILSILLSLTACEASCRVSTARLSELRMASAIDPETHQPTVTTTTFTPDAPVIFATAKVSYAPDDTRVGAAVYYMEGDEQEVVSDDMPVSGTRYVSFRVTAPNAGWPLGRYEVRFFLDGSEHDERLEFRVVEPVSDVAGVDVRPVADVPTDLKRFVDDEFGFEIWFPRDWQWRVVDGSYLIEGPPGTPAYELSFVIQFVLKSANPGSSAELQLQEAIDAVLGAPDAEIRMRDVATIGGEPAPFFGAAYTATDSLGRSGPFGHMNFVVDHGDYYWWMVYTAPADVFEEYAGVVEQAIESFRFTA